VKWSSRQYLIAFNMVPGIGGRRLVAIRNHFGSLEAAWNARREDLMKVEGIGPKTADRFCALRPNLSPRDEEAWARGLGAQIITLSDQEYPTYLRRLVVPPPVLYVLGKLPEKPGIAVVGTRKPSRVGIAQARQFSAYLASKGIPVVSGLARGIDYFAHEQVVQMGGDAVAVLGSNLGNLYPSEHRVLAKKIAEQGALITEFSSHCSTVPGNFPRRNRVIAGCSRGVLVVQAGAKSGAIHTADWALEMGLDVWAIPGEISDPLRQGTHRLIKQGAALVSEPADLLDSTEAVAGPLSEGITSRSSLEELFEAGLHANAIAAALDRPIQEVLAEISLFQLQRGSGI
jgi:DNA processing protein